MNMNRPKVFFLAALLLASLLFLTGCRVRLTSVSPGESAASDAAATSGPESASGDRETAAVPDPSEADAAGADAPADDSAGQTRENPDSPRREFDEAAEAEVVPGLERELSGEGEGQAASVPKEDAERSSARLSGEAPLPATLTVPAEDAERAGISEDAEEAQSALQYYSVLLEERQSSLFECKRLNAYLEMESDYLTVYRTSPEHRMLLDSGCYDVSSRLTEERLQVDSGWVVRKNPDLIVKIVPSAVLGGGVSDAGQAGVVRSALSRRPGWEEMAAVRSGRIVLLSAELMGDAPWLRLCAELAVAKAAYPDLFPDVDLREAQRMLMEEATGLVSEAVYFDLGDSESLPET